MDTWYQTSKYSTEINTVLVDRSTDASVWICGRRKARCGDWESYFPTWKEAHESLLSKASGELDAARGQLQRAQSKCGNIKGMKESTP